MDARVLDKGTCFQTDIGMTGDYNSVIGMKKENAIKRMRAESNPHNELLCNQLCQNCFYL